MLDLAQFRGLVGKHIAALPSVVYFHENQLTYPTRFAGERDLHFAMTNFTTALAASQVWFNSAFHRRSFLDAAQAWLARMPDYVPSAELAAIERKSSVQSPGIDVQGQRATRRSGPLHIAWAARWEHDKNPQTFFDALRLLQQQHVDFRLTVCGQSFRDVPPEFAAAQQEFWRITLNIGENCRRAARSLKQLSRADVFVSTALHEFFGLAVMESIALGLYPLLPKRLSYPELLAHCRTTTCRTSTLSASSTTDLPQNWHNGSPNWHANQSYSAHQRPTGSWPHQPSVTPGPTAQRRWTPLS